MSFPEFQIYGSPELETDQVTNPEWGPNQCVLIEYYSPTQYWESTLNTDFQDGNIGFDPNKRDFIIAYTTFKTPGNGTSALEQVISHLQTKAAEVGKALLHVRQPTTPKGKKFGKRTAEPYSYKLAWPEEELCYYRLFEG